MFPGRRSHHPTRRGVRRGPLVATGALLAGGSALTTAAIRGLGDNVILTVVAAALVGSLIALAATWVIDRRNVLIRTRRDLAKITSVPNLAVIPRQPSGAERPEDVVMFRDPNSIDAEAYRTLRTTFEFLERPTAAPGRATVVLVTSPRPGEGKSSVAANFAAAAAMAGRRVALVDGDLRKPQIHRLFRLPNTVGLSSLLSGGTRLTDAVQRLDGISTLIVLSAGPPPHDPAELLTDDRLATVLTVLSKTADLVVIDAPPLLAVADPAIIVQHCDVVLMVATADFSAKREWVEALARLAVMDATVIGTVLLEPDDRVRAVQTYRYAPGAVPQNWWVTTAPAAAGTPADAGTVGLRVVGGTDADSGADDVGEAIIDGWPEHPTGR
jgi:polysaccharide biosynthesis transport protein